MCVNKKKVSLKINIPGFWIQSRQQISVIFVLPWKKFRIEIYSEPIRFIPKSVSEPIRIRPTQSDKSFQSRLMQIGKMSM